MGNKQPSNASSSSSSSSSSSLSASSIGRSNKSSTKEDRRMASSSSSPSPSSSTSLTAQPTKKVQSSKKENAIGVGVARGKGPEERGEVSTGSRPSQAQSKRPKERMDDDFLPPPAPVAPFKGATTPSTPLPVSVVQVPIQTRTQSSLVSSSSSPSFSSSSSSAAVNKQAAAKIQAAWKGHQTRYERDILGHWKLFNDLENRQEADVLQLAEFLDALHMYMPRMGGRPSEEAMQIDAHHDNISNVKMLRQLSHQSLGSIDITDLYQGVRLAETITLQNVLNIIEMFKGGMALHRNFVIQIVEQATEVFMQLPNIPNVSMEPAPHVTIVGDLHGQLDDLLLILRENGLPSEANPYIFNGDLVDRGKNSIEVALIIYAFVVLYPKSVFVNRGNHEDASVTTVFGFMKECNSKYDLEVYDWFLESFRWLPVATLLNHQIFVVHGGIGRKVCHLSEIDPIPRYKYQLARTLDQSKLSASERQLQSQLDILRDFYWSDPQNHKGMKENTRGAGVLFGYDHVERFLKLNRLQLVVRSHECVPQGYQWPFGKRGMVVTLFSASNYCGKTENYGAFLKVFAEKGRKPSFFQFVAHPSERKPTTSTTSSPFIIAENLEALFSIILEHSLELERAFESRDVEKRGVVSLTMWCQVMEEVLNMNLRWFSLQPLVCTRDVNGLIPYRDFLDRYQAEFHMSKGSFRLHNTPATMATATMATMTSDANDEFKKGDDDDDDDEVNNKNVAKQDETESFVMKAVASDDSLAHQRDVFNSLYKHRTRLEALFHAFDADGNGLISAEEFQRGIQLLNSHLPASQRKFDNIAELMDMLDLGKTKEININHFLESFRINARMTRQAKWKRAKLKLRAVSKLKIFTRCMEVKSET